MMERITKKKYIRLNINILRRLSQLLLFFLTCAALACKADNPQHNDFYAWAKRGEAIPSVVCKTDQSLSYALYLPQGYRPNSAWPLIVCFDPKGNGAAAVALFKETAEKKGCIVAGSNNSKNGLDVSSLSHITDVLLSDIMLKMNIDGRKILLAGFSGGARVALSLGLSRPGIAGVIACSAGFQPYAGQPLTNIVGIAGTSDMNYLELKKLENVLPQMGVHYQLLTFDGKHHWPSAALLEEAVDVLDIFTTNSQELKNKFVAKNLPQLTRLAQIAKEDSTYKAYVWMQMLANVCPEALTTPQTDSLKTTITENKLLQKALKNEAASLQYEADAQQELIGAFSNQPLNWWDIKIKQIKTAELKAQNSFDRYAASRLLGFISLASYSYVGASIRQLNWPQAEHLLYIYGLADPQNPDYHYFKACYLVNTDHEAEAVLELKQCIALGFSDVAKLSSDPLLKGIGAKM